VRLLYVFTGGRASRLRATRAGEEAPREFLFGIPHLEERGHHVDLVELPDLVPDRQSPAYQALERENVRLQQVTGFTSTSHLFVGGVDMLNGYDAIVAVGDSIALGLSRFVRDRSLRPPMFAICMKMLQRYPAQAGSDPWPDRARDLPRELYYRLATGRYRERQRWYRELLECSRAVLYFARSEYDMTRRMFPDLASRARLCTQCVDTDFWRPGPAAGGDGPIVFMGNDRGRDVDLVREIAARLPHRRFVFVTNRIRPDEVAANVTLRQGDWKTAVISDIEVREILRGSAVVMLPFQTTGLDTLTSVALQAMACGKTVVVSKTAGLWEPEFVDRDNVCFISEPGPDEWCRTLESLMNDPAARDRIGAKARSLIERQNNATVLGTTMEAIVTAT
jgi:glycosyltransferase involved in cell wall biosynthesis